MNVLASSARCLFCSFSGICHVFAPAYLGLASFPPLRLGFAPTLFDSLACPVSYEGKAGWSVTHEFLLESLLEYSL